MDLPFGGKVPFEYALTVEGAERSQCRGRVLPPWAHDRHRRPRREQRHRPHHAGRAQARGGRTHLVRFDPRSRATELRPLVRPGPHILVRHELYDYHWPHLSPREVPLGLPELGRLSREYYDQLVAWLDAEPRCVAFQPGTFQIAQGVAAMRGLYRRADLLICNRRRRSDRRRGPRPAVRYPRVPAPSRAAHRRRDGRPRRRLRVGRVAALSSPLVPRSLPTEGADRGRGRVLLGARRRTGQGPPAADGAGRAPVNAMSVVQEVGSQTGLLHESELLQPPQGTRPRRYAVTTW